MKPEITKNINIKNQKIMEKETRITAPEGCEIEKLKPLYGIKEGGEE